MISQNKIEEFVPNDRTRLVRTMVKSTSRFKCRDGQFYWQTNYDILGVMADRLLTASSQMSLVPVRSYLWSILNCQDIIVFAIYRQHPLKFMTVFVCSVYANGMAWQNMYDTQLCLLEDRLLLKTDKFHDRPVLLLGQVCFYKTERSNSPVSCKTGCCCHMTDNSFSRSSLCWQDRKE